jgi:hypothetical protein
MTRSNCLWICVDVCDGIDLSDRSTQILELLITRGPVIVLHTEQCDRLCHRNRQVCANGETSVQTYDLTHPRGDRSAYWALWAHVCEPKDVLTHPDPAQTLMCEHGLPIRSFQSLQHARFVTIACFPHYVRDIRYPKTKRKQPT